MYFPHKPLLREIILINSKNYPSHNRFIKRGYYYQYVDYTLVVYENSKNKRELLKTSNNFHSFAKIICEGDHGSSTTFLEFHPFKSMDWFIRKVLL